MLLTQLHLYFRPEEYKKKVSEYVKKYASEEALKEMEASAVSSSSESSMSDFSEDEAQVRQQICMHGTASLQVLFTLPGYGVVTKPLPSLALQYLPNSRRDFV